MTAQAKAEELGATEIHSGINWTWANGFSSEENALAFVAWLEEREYEHRGVYPPVEDGIPSHYKFAVRYR